MADKKTQSKKSPAKKPAAQGSANKAAPSRAKSVATPAKPPRRREIGAAICLLLGVFAFIGYWDGSGMFIGFFRDVISGLVGAGFFAVPWLLLLCAVTLGFHRGRPVRFRVMCALLLSVAVGALYQTFGANHPEKLSLALLGDLWRDGTHSGGLVAGFLAELFIMLFSKVGAAIALIVGALCLLLAAFNRTVAGLVDAFRDREKREYEPEPEREPAPPRGGKRKPEPVAPAPQPQPVPPQPKTEAEPQPSKRRRGPAIDIPLVDADVPPEPTREPEEVLKPQERKPFFDPKPRVITPDQAVEHGDAPPPVPPPVAPTPPPTAVDAPTELAPPPKKKAERVAAADIVIEDSVLGEDEYPYPPPSLLTAPVAAKIDGSDEIQLNSSRIETAFSSFGIKVKVSNTVHGPSVTRYEFVLEPGVKLSRLTGLSDDIALSLGVKKVRISAIQNKIRTVGIEVPNKNISTVYLREIIESRAFASAQSRLSFAIGKSIEGEPIIGNIQRLPHLLVAGETGSGKSVFLNLLILSILYKATPDEVRMIMIDPKMVEFRVYSGIPHLLVPVVTDMSKAAGALQWAVVEMEKRYRMFSEVNSRKLEEYNKHMSGRDEPTLPQVIIVIDELADLMMTARKEVEESICRVAQKGRAAGIHLIVATQRPSVDVITGLMKSNIPSRVALKVASATNSRIIIDEGGAEQLIGNGDMLYMPTGESPLRVQGAYVSDTECEAIVEYIKQNGETQYSAEVESEIERAATAKSSGGNSEATDSSDFDEMLPQAAEVIFEKEQASVSILQRRLKLGYARAARIVDQLEQIGLVGPLEGSKPRAILLTVQQWREMQLINGTAPVGAASSADFAADEDEDDETDDEPAVETGFEDEDDDAPF
ncbi:MAG: DNA translocase FtsK [Oscillospiraceae bacterium]|jgi:S-DNA-T family DNA segregation ATPase FtsK/SpoIIIE|nr:DNA translocase FtsK [Oscillospiraceae bacterium]